MKKEDTIKLLFALSKKFGQKEAGWRRGGNNTEAEKYHWARVLLVEEAVDLGFANFAGSADDFDYMEDNYEQTDNL